VAVRDLYRDVKAAIAAYEAWTKENDADKRAVLRAEGKALETALHRWFPGFKASDPDTHPTFPVRVQLRHKVSA
jgi:hypothetical protein